MINAEMAPEREVETVTVVVGRFEPIVVRGLVDILGEGRDIRILASDLGEAALERAVVKERPQVAILGETVEHSLLMRLKSRQPATAVLVLASDPSVLRRTTLLAAGATCLASSASAEELTMAVRLAAQGSRGLRADEARRFEQGGPGKTRLLTQREIENLTESEIEVLGYLSRGLSYAQIALKMHRAEATVKTHAARIRRKLGVKHKHELIGMQIPTPPGSQGH